MRFSILLSLALMAPSLDAESLKIATLYPPGSEAVASLEAASERIDAATDGRVSLKLYPGGVMGDDSTVLRKLRIGQLDGALVSSGTLELIDVAYSDLSQPFQFDSLEAVHAARETFDATLKRRLRDKGWYGFGPLDGGFSYVMSTQPVRSLDALRERKLWLPNTEEVRTLSRRMGVDYTVLGIGDVLPALDTGAIDTLIAPPSAALTLGWHSRLDTVTDQPVIYTWGILILPQRTLDRLPEDDRGTTIAELNQWAEDLDTRLRQSNREAKAALTALLEEVSILSASLAEIRLEVQTQ